jgi:hypothetical protein
VNWAAEHELPEGQKTSHHAVDYQAHAKGDDDCDDCRNFIVPKRCRTVATPVSKEGWCVRFSRIRREEIA